MGAPGPGDLLRWVAVARFGAFSRRKEAVQAPPNGGKPRSFGQPPPNRAVGGARRRRHGVAVNALGFDLPDPVLTPFELVGQATVPLMLLAFGMSLRRNGRPFRNGDTAGIVLAVALKTVAAPLVAVAIGSTVFGFGGKDLLAPVLCSALPTAQNVYVYSLRYPGSTALARDAVLLSLIVAVPVLVVFSAVFSNG